MSGDKEPELVAEVKDHSRRRFISMASASIVAAGLPLRRTKARLHFVCSPANDLFKAAGAPGSALDSPQQAIDAADFGDGVLILAEHYPASATRFSQAIIDAAAKKHLRLYIEYPAWLPEMDISPRKAEVSERAVITSSRFGAQLKPSRIVSVNDCRYVSVSASNPDIVLARVAGFDTAAYGLEKIETHPILFENSAHSLMIATTKLSQYRTARYGPSDAWTLIWEKILEWLSGGKEVELFKGQSAVRPSYRRTQALPSDVEHQSFERGVKWFLQSRLLIHPSWQNQVEPARVLPDSVAPAPAHGLPIGNGSCGMLEGFSSSIDIAGNQPVRWALRADCMGEASLTFALSSGGDAEKHSVIAKNLIKFIYDSASLAGGPRAEESSPSFGLLNWEAEPRGLYYGDDNARCLLGIIGAAGLLRTSEWDKNILRTILANYRTTGAYGFRGEKIRQADLDKNGIRYYQQMEREHFAPHFEAYPWALYLWAYAKTGYKPLLDRTLIAIRKTMSAYPDSWQWSYGIQQERARMLLPLAWLVRVVDNSEHRGWLRFMAEELLKHQTSMGAILEQIGQQAKGSCGPPASNADYGTGEASLIQGNADSVCDLLYTSNFAFLGLHEAAAATGDRYYSATEDRLARLLCRIQIRSEDHPELDGGWFRAFSPAIWDYWASNSDSGWGAWAIESGWTQAWITSVLAMRSKALSLWAISEKSTISAQMDRVLREFAPSGGI